MSRVATRGSRLAGRDSRVEVAGAGAGAGKGRG